MSHHLMLVPSLACPASCAYCFGPHAGGKTMGRETLEAVVEWQRGLGGESDDEGGRDGANGPGTLEITFHGGEPLVPGARWYREALPLLRDGLAPRRVRFAAQSNLWLLTDELCELFREHGVSLGTSLDGPEAINDAQRGAGYFAKTMAGIERARAHGIDVGAICTFTAGSVAHAPEIFDFFVREGLNFSVHAALPSLRHPEADRWSITPEAHGELLVGLLDRYLEDLTRVRISTLDSMARSVSAGRGGICTFGECLGGYLAVGPDGAIYPCQRFAGMPEYRVGDVARRPSLEELRSSPVWREFRAREEHVEETCGDCAYFGFCKGGCPYNALVGAGGVLAPTARDPHCASYRRTFDAVTERAMAEMFSPENLDAVVERPDPERGLMRRGPLLSIMRDGPHPYDTAGHARRVLASVALAASGSPAEAARRFEKLGLATNRPRVEAAMKSLDSRFTSPISGLNNLYLHVTFACNLRCSHCYAEAGPPRAGTIALTVTPCANTPWAYDSGMAEFFSSTRAVEVLIALDQSPSSSLADLARLLDVSPSGVQKALSVLEESGLVEASRESRRRVLYSIAAPATDVNGLLNIAVGSLPAIRHLAVACRANPGVAFAGYDATGWVVVLGRTATPADGVALERAIRRETRATVVTYTRDDIADRMLDDDTAVADRARTMTVCRGSVERVFADPHRHADPNAPVLGALHPSLKQPSRRAIKEIARQNGLSKIVVFGSAVHSDFRPDSDVDVLVRHRPGVARSLEAEFALQDQLEALFDRDVDVVEEGVVRPMIAQRAAREGVALYGRS